MPLLLALCLPIAPSAFVEISSVCVCVLHACVYTDGGFGCTPLLSWLLCRRTLSVIGWPRFGEKGGNTVMAQVAQSGTSRIINKPLPLSRELTADLRKNQFSRTAWMQLMPHPPIHSTDHEMVI